jgi:cholest-4-en-3-one 26-monooxygenase
MSSTFAEDQDVFIPDLSVSASYIDGVPHSAFAELQRRPGLHWVPTEVGTTNGGYWAVTRWDDIVEIEKDPATFTSTKGPNYPSTNMSPLHPAVDMLMCTDPPRHNYLRRAAAKGFAPRIVKNFEPWVREVITGIIDGVENKDEFDYVEEFGRTIPAYVVARVLGSPPEDCPKIAAMVHEFFEALYESEARGIEMMGVMTRYAEEMQQEKLKNPGDDMFTELARCVERGEITQAEYIQWMFVMIAAGYETTHTAISQSMRMYLEDPDVRELTDRAITEGRTERAVDEFLRLISPPMEMARTATRDTVVAGQEIRKDDVMVVYYIAANRDPSVFSEPDKFDPWRAETDTLAFGTGPHKCIGSHLAKLELSILWEELRARDIRLEPAGPSRRGASMYINVLAGLPVRRVRD